MACAAAAQRAGGTVDAFEAEGVDFLKNNATEFEAEAVRSKPLQHLLEPKANLFSAAAHALALRSHNLLGFANSKACA